MTARTYNRHAHRRTRDSAPVATVERSEAGAAIAAAAVARRMGWLLRACDARAYVFAAPVDCLACRTGASTHGSGRIGVYVLGDGHSALPGLLRSRIDLLVGVYTRARSDLVEARVAEDLMAEFASASRVA